jgi:hypothetical protein
MKSASHLPGEVSRWVSYIVPVSEVVTALSVIEAFFCFNSTTVAANLKINSSSNYFWVEEESVSCREAGRNYTGLSGEQFG